MSYNVKLSEFNPLKKLIKFIRQLEFADNIQIHLILCLDVVIEFFNCDWSNCQLFGQTSHQPSRTRDQVKEEQVLLS